jgi:hypothetical protein
MRNYYRENQRATAWNYAETRKLTHWFKSPNSHLGPPYLCLELFSRLTLEIWDRPACYKIFQQAGRVYFYLMYLPAQGLR